MADPTDKACCTPAESTGVSNPPGLDAVAWRIGTWSTFREAMLVRLSRFALPDGPHEDARPLAALGTRAPDDPSIALVDAFACVTDVLTFYQERIANEGFLRTATERRSVVELAKALGYAPNPGVAASVWLAFTCDETPGAPLSVDLPVGVAIQSVPGPGETPQVFETVEAIVGRPAFNALRARTTRPQQLKVGTKSLWIAGLGRPIRPGEAVLVVGEARERGQTSVPSWRERWDFRIVTAVVEDKVRGLTRLDLDRGLGWRIYDRVVEPAAPVRQLFVLRAQTSLFGHNAPAWSTLPPASRAAVGGEAATAWPGYTLEGEVESADPHVDLDGRHPKIVAGSWAVLVDGEYAEVTKVVDTSFGTRSEFLVTGPYTRVHLDPYVHHVDGFDRRRTVAWVQSEALEEGEVPVDDAITGDRIDLAGIVTDLGEGRRVVVTGTDPDGALRAEAATIRRVEESDDGLVSVLVLDAPLAGTFARTSLVVRANVARATHGETRGAEVIGSGDAAARFQAFPLRRSPLTHVSAPTPSGGASTLEIRVNGVLWTPLSTLYGAAPTTEGYVTDIADDGVVTARFGDGTAGARLPTGSENVRATYRTGLGLAGNVGADAIKLLKTKPLGLREATNPLPATGGADPEDRDAARANAPLTVRTLDRLVSRSDFEDFARAFSGVAKARAVEAWSGERRIVHVTVAAESGEPLPVDDPLLDNLRAAIAAYRDPTQGFLVQPHRQATFRIEAEVVVDARYVAADVLAAADAALREAFAFDARDLGRAVTSAAVLAVLHDVEGVVGIDLNALYRTDRATPAADAAEEDLEQDFLAAVLVADDARRVGSSMVGAEILVLDPAAAGIRLWELAP